MNWRDLYEDKDREGCDVIDVMLLDGVGVAYVYQGAAKKYVHHSGANLIKKPKPKTYRPFKAGEVVCGNLFVDDSLVTRMVVSVGAVAVSLGGKKDFISYEDLHKYYTKPNGNPAGMEE